MPILRGFGPPSRSHTLVGCWSRRSRRGADRMVLRMKRSDAAGSGESALSIELGLKTLEGIHRFVVGGLGLVLVSGVPLLCADLDTFLYAKVFWLKMVLFAVLLAKRSGPHAPGATSRPWPRVRLKPLRLRRRQVSRSGS